ncbi:GNAT family N-acetyltransferase [Lipingzhangella sp. LS1_29]|uniref:GNAT family N-acetyltransferase n=1 Tax=Lipingzhangella rawalii TaxID=2055835 RepID=A0ABU2H247_9ACTN|nr:GNAT family N-acetyltransferase [Lipingzhangella rawalii]MDS1269373.1 GNAT family N-acetyltransferase [Lipingzhangella rawalii]
MADPGSTVTMVRNRREHAMAFAIRGAVFVAEQGVPVELEWDDADDADTTRQMLAWHATQPVGVGRIVLGPSAGAARIGRLAVLPSARGRGVGAALVRGLEDLARERGFGMVELHAQVQALGFYERLGYAVDGPEFDDAGIPHRRMWQRL